MKVSEILQIKDSKISNGEKAKMIASLMKARARTNNPKDTDIPLGWNAGPTTNAGGSTL